MKQENKKKILSVFWEAAGLFPDCLGSIHTRKAVTGDRNDKTLPQIMTELLVYVGINPEYNQLIWVAPTAKRHIADELHLSVISLSLSEFKFLCMMCTYGFWQQSFDSVVYQCSNCLCHDGHMFFGSRSPFCSPSNVVIRVHPGFICPKTLFFHFESKVLFLSKSNLASSVTCGLHLVVFHSFISWLYTVANDTPKSSSESLNYVKLFFLTMELLLPLSTLESCDQPLLCYLHHFPVFLSKGLYVRLISF